MTELTYTRAQLSAIEDIYSAVPRLRRSARQWEVELDSWARQLATIRDPPRSRCMMSRRTWKLRSAPVGAMCRRSILARSRASLLREAGYR